MDIYTKKDAMNIKNMYFNCLIVKYIRSNILHVYC